MTPENSSPTSTTRVWDLPIRLFHWLLVVSLIGSWISAESGLEYIDWHMRLGYVALTLVSFRLFWGFWGSQPARFSSFLHSPGALLNYSKTLGKRSSKTHPGHNPLGGAMTLLLLLLIALQAGSGLFSNDDIFTEGPLYGWVSNSSSDLLTRIHHLNFNLLLVAALLHITAVLFYLLYKRQNLIKAMITGNMQLTDQQATSTRPQAPLWRAVLFIIICAGAVTWLVQ